MLEVHGRRGFVEIEKYFPEQCTYVLNVFSKIYENETEVKKLGLNDKERKLYHRKHSRPHMKQLYRWLTKQLREKLVEENNSLGKAIKYLLRHVKRLTRFLRVPGAPLGRVENWRANQIATYLLSACVSSPRSSNRTCATNASGFRTKCHTFALGTSAFACAIL